MLVKLNYYTSKWDVCIFHRYACLALLLNQSNEFTLNFTMTYVCLYFRVLCCILQQYTSLLCNTIYLLKLDQLLHFCMSFCTASLLVLSFVQLFLRQHNDIYTCQRAGGEFSPPGAGQNIYIYFAIN